MDILLETSPYKGLPCRKLFLDEASLVFFKGFNGCTRNLEVDVVGVVAGDGDDADFVDFVDFVDLVDFAGELGVMSLGIGCNEVAFAAAVVSMVKEGECLPCIVVVLLWCCCG